MKDLNVGVVGATGVVGEEFQKLLIQRDFPVGELRLFASDRSAGTKMNFRDKKIELRTLSAGCFKGLDLVFFSSGDDISLEWAPRAVQDGAFAIDNSGAFRMKEDIHLVVPEVNGDLLPKPGKPAIIANPNCSTIQLVMALKPLDDDFGVTNVRVASYQAVSGAGKAGKDELLGQLKSHAQGHSEMKKEVFAHPIAFNCLPHIGSFNDDGFSSEEVKIMKETKKILRRPKISVSAFTVRIPVLNAHSEAVWVTFKNKATREQLIQSLEKMDGVEVLDNPKEAQYPTALMASGADPVYVGRIHRDLDDENTWMMWVVADNLRKGAALNGIQIAERIFDLSRF